MTCMCGDLYCPSCGPAQGNNHCIICGKWSMDGGCDNPKDCADEILGINRKDDLIEAEIEIAEAKEWGRKPEQWAIDILENK